MVIICPGMGKIISLAWQKCGFETRTYIIISTFFNKMHPFQEKLRFVSKDQILKFADDFHIIELLF